MMSPGEAQIRSLKVYFSPKQEGSGDPSPENVRPITGYEGVKVEHCGKNLYNYTASTGIYQPIYMKANQEYTISCISSGNGYFRGKYVDDTLTGNVWVNKISSNGRHYITVIPKNDIKACFIFLAQGLSQPMIELGSSPTEYEPYKNRISRVPSEYQEVEYLQSTGTQYIDLDFGFDSTDEIETRFSIDIKHWTDKYIVSPSNWNTNDNRFAMGVHSGTAKLGAGYYTVGYGHNTTSNTRLLPEVLNDGEFHDWRYKDYTFSITDVYSSRNVSSITFGSTTANLRLFYGYNSKTRGKIASYHHKKANGTEINLIPCYRISDSKPGMYDTISGQFYTNSGTGEFITGPAVNKYDIDWSDDVGTVYGGYVDLISGELVETWDYKSIASMASINAPTSSSEPWSHRWSLRNWITGVGYDTYQGGKVICDKLKTVRSANENYQIQNEAVESRIYMYDNEISTVSELREKYADFYMAYQLKTGAYKTHTLSKASLTTFLNSNTLWANADKIEIEYDLVETDEIQQIRRKILLNTPHLEEASGSVAQFNTDLRTKLKDGRIYFSPVQEGEGTPSPENVRPISGWDGITITRCGKNLFNLASGKSGRYTNQNGTWVFENSIGWFSTELIRIKPNTLYTVFGGSPLTTIIAYINVYNENMERTNYSTIKPYITTTSDAKYLSVHSSTTSDFYKNLNTIMICEGSDIPDSYEAYNGEQATITFPQTIYGGYVDLKNGEVVETHEHCLLTEVNSEALIEHYNDDTTVFFRCNSSSLYSGNGSYDVDDLKCDTLNSLNIGIQIPSSKYINSIGGRYKNKSRFALRMLKSIFDITEDDTLTTMKTKISAYLADNPIGVSYKLATPIHHSLTIPEILTLRGTNTLWSNGNGNLQVTYWTH